MWLSRYICLFVLYSVLGWIYESLFCTIKGGKWENRGFLYGPVCPIYGTGATAILLIVSAVKARAVVLNPWMVFAISVAGSAILEYATSWLLEKLFHAVWWDYSRLPLNLHGRISLFTSLGFGFGGLLIVYILAPLTDNLTSLLSPIAAEALSLVFVFLLAVDITLTVSALLRFDQMVQRAEDSFNQNMDSLVDGAINRTRRLRKDLADARSHADLQLRSMSAFVKAAIRRANAFRDRDKRIESVKNQLLSLLRQAGKRGKGRQDKRGGE